MNLFDKGWECPKCGAVMSPTTSCCVNCRGYGVVTINTNFANYIENAPFPFVKDEPKESEVAKWREDIEKSPVDCSTPSVTDSKGDTE